ncbi:hypothetical protein ALC60_12935 [Trachymyrmex zeteki]|uniref:Uncharacterized protein n=1 Tax=Mycetomoellerius zeteki TaxID=64791 RepID=A0A151WJG0_9HYME|nr:hypothetical protein ALC60_12935 [Trachymyrmex zeteki]
MYTSIPTEIRLRLGNGEVQGENTRHEEKGRREARVKEPSVTPATFVIYLLPPPPPPRLCSSSSPVTSRGVIFQRTGKCSHYREKPCGAPARRCTITRQPSVRERRQPVAQMENHARWRTTFLRRRISHEIVRLALSVTSRSINNWQYLGTRKKKPLI